MTRPAPTDDVAKLVALIGEDATLALLEARGGTRIYIGEPVLGRNIADIIGVDAAAKLHSVYGRDRLTLPLGRAWRVLQYKARGLSYLEMALKAGCSQATVYQILKRNERTAKQYELFDRSA